VPVEGLSSGFGLGLFPNVVDDWQAVVLIVVLCVAAGLLVGKRPRVLRRLDVGQLRTRRGRRRLAAVLLIGVPAAVSVGLLDHYTVRLADVIGNVEVGLTETPGVVRHAGTWVGLVLPALLLFGLRTRPSVVPRPSTIIWQGLAHDVLIIGAVAFMIGAAGGPDWGVTLGLPLGGLITAMSPWPRYAVAVLTLHRAGALPPRPAHFLNWAYTAGLVRRSGIAVQFRHREYQKWLDTH
jgi:hypothetical protein